jgi:hypothetical protein
LRWFDNNLDKISQLIPRKKIIILADDLYSRNPLVERLNAENLNFILNCKKTSHKSLWEFTEYNKLESLNYYDTVKGQKGLKLHTINWLSGLPLRDMAESETVNWFRLTIKDVVKTKKIVTLDNNGSNIESTITELKDLEFSFITNLEINESNAREIVAVGRSRWKIENNNFNVLKNSGYNIKHNFGHGHKFLSSTLLTLNILAFSFHNILLLFDKNWSKTYYRINKRIKFFINKFIVLVVTFLILLMSYF